MEGLPEVVVFVLLGVLIYKAVYGYVEYKIEKKGNENEQSKSKS